VNGLAEWISKPVAAYLMVISPYAEDRCFATILSEHDVEEAMPDVPHEEVVFISAFRSVDP
jgi:hypothetical protein